VDKRVDYSIFEVLILELLTEDKGLDEEIDLFPIASRVTHILRTEYAVSVYPLDVQSKSSRVIVWKGDPSFLAFFPAVVRSCSKIGRFFAKQVLMYSVLRFIGPHEYCQGIETIAREMLEKHQ
jgi:hypothetical protein